MISYQSSSVMSCNKVKTVTGMLPKRTGRISPNKEHATAAKMNSTERVKLRMASNSLSDRIMVSVYLLKKILFPGNQAKSTNL